MATKGGDRLEFVSLDGAPETGHPSGMTYNSLTSLISRTGGNKARVARNLGVSRVTIYRWLRQLDPGAA